MTLASTPMSMTSRFGLSSLFEQHGLKLLRYCGVSVVNVILGTGTLLFCLKILDMHEVLANVVAWTVSTGPAYLMSRYWVWEQSGTNSVKSEIAPFWILALIGLSFSTFCIWVAGFHTDNSYVLTAVNFCAYGIVWVAKYIVLDRLMWGPGATGDVEIEVA